jgi:hypothetical protein
VSERDLREVLAAVAADSRISLPIIAARGHEPDHPTRPGFPEGHYLKLLIATVDGSPIPRRFLGAAGHTSDQRRRRGR